METCSYLVLNSYSKCKDKVSIHVENEAGSVRAYSFKKSYLKTTFSIIGIIISVSGDSQ